MLDWKTFGDLHSNLERMSVVLGLLKLWGVGECTCGGFFWGFKLCCAVALAKPEADCLLVRDCHFILGDVGKSPQLHNSNGK
uniref:Uncharacterized protein n=1 Tax=Ixodes ricinus TaxID=34613 RepID=A0A0K8REL6_IXORI